MQSNSISALLKSTGGLTIPAKLHTVGNEVVINLYGCLNQVNESHFSLSNYASRLENVYDHERLTSIYLTVDGKAELFDISVVKSHQFTSSSFTSLAA